MIPGRRVEQHRQMICDKAFICMGHQSRQRIVRDDAANDRNLAFLKRGWHIHKLPSVSGFLPGKIFFEIHTVKAVYDPATCLTVTQSFIPAKIGSHGHIGVELYPVSAL